MQLSIIFARHKVTIAYQQLSVCQELTWAQETAYGAWERRSQEQKLEENSCPGICFLKLEMINSGKDSGI